MFVSGPSTLPASLRQAQKVQNFSALSTETISTVVENLIDAATALAKQTNHKNTVAITPRGYFGVTSQKCGGGLADVPSMTILTEGMPPHMKNILPPTELLTFMNERNLEIYIPVSLITNEKLEDGLLELLPTLGRIQKTADIQVNLGSSGLALHRDPVSRNKITLQLAPDSTAAA